MHILIGGEDEVAFRLAEALMEEHEVTLILPETDEGGTHSRLDVEMVFGRVTSADVLRRAGVESAEIFIGAAPIDEQNLVSCLTASRLGAKRTICFQFRPETQASEDDVDAFAESLGLGLVVRPAHQLSTEILRIIAVPGALDVEAFEGGRVHLLRHAIEDGAPITRGPLKDVGVPEGVVLVMARRDDEMLLPKGDTHFQPGDKVTAMGTMAGINRLLSRYLRTSANGSQSTSATVVGGGVVGLSVALGLEEAGWNVKLIESSRKRSEAVSALVQGLVLHGDGTDLDLLEEEQIGESGVLVAVTSHDEKNLLVSLLAKSLGVKRIVTRANHVANERLFEKVGIDVVRSASGAAMRSVLRRIDTSRSQLLAELEHGDAEVIELKLPAGLKPVPLTKMRTEVFAIIGAILRKGRVIIPRGDDVVQGDDRLLVFCTKEEDDKIRNFLMNRLEHLAEDGSA